MPVCPNCGEENPERFRLCGFCGAALRPAAPSALEERKTVSVLFVDLVGFTARSDAADPEDVRATLAPYHSRLKTEIERFGGTVEKFIGDAVMAVFGAPIAHEDDAERAVRASLRILAAIDELNSSHPGLDLAVRAAVNTGEAVVSLTARPEAGEGIVTGDVVNTASRLQNAAPTNSVVVGEQTFRSTRDQIVYEPLDPVTVKGKAEPIPIWRALEARSRYGVDVETRPPTPFIGRTHEQAVLQQTYARALQESSVQLVTLTGEPGVGKTRLLTEFHRFVDDRPEIVFWRQGRCLPYGEGITFWALGEVVKAQAGILESDPPDQAAEKLGQAVATVAGEGEDRDWLTARLARLVGTAAAEDGAASDRAEAFTAWRRFLEAVAATRPLVLVLEDLHWADQAMVEFVEHLVDWAVEVPLLVLCTARPELYERHPGWGGGKRNSTTISLSPLTTEETARLISELLAEAVLPAETQGALLERSGGNPLYAEEFVRMLLDRGILVRKGRTLTLTAGPEDIPLPETVHALIAARLDTLSAERKALLQDASVIGKVFWSGAVATMGAVPEPGAREGLQELVRKELVRPARISSVKDQSEYSFWHILVRDVAYAQIPRAARARKHRAAALWMESMAGERVADHAELLAHHHTEALALARAAGAAPGEVADLEERARRFLVMSAERALGLDLERAATHYHRALELSPPGHAERAPVLRRLSEAEFYLTRLEESEEHAREAVEGFRERRERPRAGEAMAWLDSVLWARGKASSAGVHSEEAVALLEQEPPGPELASVYSRMAWAGMLLGRDAESLQWAEKALALSERLGMERLAMRTLQFLGSARCALGDVGGVDDLRESVRRGLEHSFLETGMAYNNLANWVWLVEGPARALETYRSGIEYGERRGLLGPSKWSRSETAWPLYDLGRWDELMQESDGVLEWSRQQGTVQMTAIVLPYRARVLLHRGRIGEAAELADEFLPLARSLGDAQIILPSLTTAAMVEHARGNREAALELVDEFARFTKDRPSWRAHFLVEATRVLVEEGALDAAEELARDPFRAAARHANGALSTEAMFAEARGEAAEALVAHGRAAAAWEEYGSALERAHALLGEGRCLIVLGRPGEAIAPLRDGREVLSRLGAVSLVADADSLLERATALSS
jgi:class 3 adenylate cyclase/tetratricopeptide (TPR) repeat protein